MGITYKIDVEAGVMYSVAEGDVGAADIQAHRNRFPKPFAASVSLSAR